MKEQILNYLRCDRSFEKGRALYMQFGKKMGFLKSLNTQAESDFLLSVLHNELAELAAIDNKQLHVILHNPIMVMAQAKEESGKKEETIEDKPDPVVLAEKEKVITGMKAVLKLREEFPFLSDPDCPDEFKILVADKYSAYIKFKEAHADLFKAENEDELLNASSTVVENVLDNQAIWDELNHYNKTGGILGNHPIFKRKDLREKYLALDIPSLISARENCKKRISGLNTEIKNNKKPEKLRDKQENLKAKEEELDILNKLLGFKNA